MATPGTLITPRGERTVYMHIRDNSDLSYRDADYVFDAESDVSGEAEFDGIDQTTLDLYTDADFNTIDVDPGAGETNQVLTYNPITDNYSIVSGEYVL
jgi:hypothetical protein